jgi:hypothetical protein
MPPAISNAPSRCQPFNGRTAIERANWSISGMLAVTLRHSASNATSDRCQRLYAMTNGELRANAVELLRHAVRAAVNGKYPAAQRLIAQAARYFEDASLIEGVAGRNSGSVAEQALKGGASATGNTLEHDRFTSPKKTIESVIVVRRCLGQCSAHALKKLSRHEMLRPKDTLQRRPCIGATLLTCSEIGLEPPLTMYKRASSLLERSEGFFCRNRRKNFEVVEWIFRLGR